MTTIIVGLQNSVLVLESSKSGWKTYESLKGSHPQGIAFDHLDPTEHIVGLLATVYGKLIIVDERGIILERMESLFLV